MRSRHLWVLVIEKLTRLVPMRGQSGFASFLVLFYNISVLGLQREEFTLLLLGTVPQSAVMPSEHL